MNRQNPLIRPAGVEDVSALHRLSGELGYPSTPSEIDARLDRLARSRDDAVFVAQSDGGEILGWVHVFSALRLESDGFAEIGGLVVSDRWRRRGVGQALMRSCLDWATERGHEKLRVRTRTGREEAHLFYGSLGFARTKTQEVFDLAPIPQDSPS